MDMEDGGISTGDTENSTSQYLSYERPVGYPLWQLGRGTNEFGTT